MSDAGENGDELSVELRIGGWLPPVEQADADAGRDQPTWEYPTLGVGNLARSGTATSRGGPAHARATRRAAAPAPAAPRRRRGLLVAAAVATVAAAAGVPVLFHPTLDGAPPEHVVDPAPPLLLGLQTPTGPVTPGLSVAPTAGPSSVAPSLTGGTTFPPTPGRGATAPGVTGPTAGSGGPSAAGTGIPLLAALSLEAEGPSAIRGGRTTPRPLAAASAGMVVGSIGLGSGNVVRFPTVIVPADGDYLVTFHYASPEPGRAMVTCNGRSEAIRLPQTGNGGNAIGTVSVRLSLRAGPNTVEYGNQRDEAPDLDRIVVTAVT
jgi:hypothetical protein